MPRKLKTAVFAGLPLSALETPFVNHLRDGRKSENTVKQYVWALHTLIRYLEAECRPGTTDRITSDDVSALQRHLLATRTPSTADAVHRALKVFFRWAVTDGEMPANPIERIPRPKVVTKPLDVIPLDYARRLFKTCEGSGYEEVRDMAVLRLLWDSGGRRAELGTLTVEDIRFESNTAVVRGKGDKLRTIPFTAKTARALRRYLTMARPRHPDADGKALWLGGNGPMTPDGIRHILDKRTMQADLPHLKPHQFRATMAARFLAKGGNQVNLKLLMGWTTDQMVSRYIAAVDTELAHGEYRRLEMDDV